MATTKTLDINTLAVAAPASPPTGYTKATGAQDGRVVQFTVREWAVVSGGTQSVWYDNTNLTGTWISSTVKLGTTNGSSCGPVLSDASGNGWQAISVDGANNVRIFLMVAGQLSGPALLTLSQTHTAGNDLMLRRNTSSGVMQIWVNGSQIGTPGSNEYTSSTYDPRFAGMVSRGGYLRSLTSEYTPSRTVDTITDPIVLGSAISVGLTGFTAPTSVTGGGMSATGISYAAGTLTATWPALSETLAPTVALPATDLTITVTESGGSATITADANLPAGYVATTFMSVIDDPRYIGGNITLSDGWLAYYDNDQAEVGNIEIQADGRIIADNAGTFIVFLHKFGGDNSITQYNITINEAGDVVNIGLTSPGLVSRGLVTRGLVRAGL